ncbi:acyl-CoA N-acyltransferase [Xylaria venustula]|nr:acyl-CoA N-acyltransferase [Xylaria venustula]
MASIRPRRDEDLAACVEILKVVYLKSGYPVGGVDDALEVLRADNQAWVAEDNGIVIGHVAMNLPPKTSVNVALWLERYPHDADVAVLSRLFVDPEKRGRGAATKLVRTVEEEARRKGKRLLILLSSRTRTRSGCIATWDGSNMVLRFTAGARAKR